MWKLRLTPVATGLLLVVALATPGAASAAIDSDDTVIPVDATTQLQMHTTANCVLADGQCYFTASANLITPNGPTGFPDDLWARQTTTVRSSDRDSYLDSDFNAPNTKMFKSNGLVDFTTIYYGGGPVDKYRLVGNTRPRDWKTGQLATESDYIVCSHIQVIYGGHNLTSPSTCSQTHF